MAFEMDDNMQTEAPRKNAIGWPIILAGLFLIVSLWLLYPLILKFVVGIDAENLGLWGDQFGGFNALFSGLAFAGLILTLYFQSNELALQREELGLQRAEQKEATQQLEQQAKQLEIQAEQLKAQNRLALVQAFENGFFNILQSFDQYKAQTTIPTSSKDKPPLVGQDAYKEICKTLLRRSGGLYSTGEIYSATEFRERLYPALWKDSQTKLEPYFRLIEAICHKIESFNSENREQYVNLLKARLSSDDLVLISIHCAANNTSARLIRYVQKFDLLEYADDKNLRTHSGIFNVIKEVFKDYEFYKKLCVKYPEEPSGPSQSFL